MAVYTHVTESELVTFVSAYGLGNVVSYKGIAAGVENSNYILTTDAHKLILTIYEKRVNHHDLPFFISLMEHLAKEGVPCPQPMRSKKGDVIGAIQNKPASITTFLEGISTSHITPEHCAEVGRATAEMHLAAGKFAMTRSNALSLNAWLDMAENLVGSADSVARGMKNEIENAVIATQKHWPKVLPSGVIHADIFPDNVFFIDKKLSGIIDFYFACNDFFAYEIAIILNAWCFEKNYEFNITKAKALLAGYHAVRKISESELEALPILARGAALRFLLTRLHDWLNPKEGAIVSPKDPREYLAKLRFHASVTKHSEYGL